MIVELKQARHLLATRDWVGPKHEPFCVATAQGVRVNAKFGEQHEPLWKSAKWAHTLDAQHKGLLRYSVRGACDVAGAAFGQLEQLLELEDLQQWLQEPNRTKDDVLRAFLRAIERSKKAGRR